MKRLIYLAMVCIALVACNKKNNALNGEQPETETEATPFTKGQVVTIGVSSGDMGDNAPIRTVSGTDNGDKFSFKWEAGDKILVTVRDTVYPYPEIDPEYYEVTPLSAEFTLASGAGTASATFTGEMPGSSKWFEIQYPVSDPNLSTQTYEAGKIASGMMKFNKSGVTLDSEGNCNVTLEPQYAILQLNLYGLARSVNQIKVIDAATSNVKHTLTCSPAVTVSTDKNNPTLFYIVMNSASIQLKIDVDMTAGTVENSDLPDYLTYGKGIPTSVGTFVQGAAKTIAAGTCVNMPAISLTTVWAPVNCGYDPVDYKYGLLYQWGRKDGSGYQFTDKTSDRPQEIPYNDAGEIRQMLPNCTEFPEAKKSEYDSYSIICINGAYRYFTTSTTSPIAAGNENAGYFYNTTDQEDWLLTKDDNRWDATGGSSTIHFPTKGTYDPCPTGWRVPTYAEMQALLGSHTSGGLQTGTHGTAREPDSTDPKGKWFNGTSEATPTTGVFLPAAGYRVSNASGSAFMRGRVGNYWTSSVSDDRACRFGFTDTKASVSTNDARSPGYSIRCVRE